MSDIDPQEFGELRAQVAMLIKSDADKSELLQKMSTDMTAIRLQLAEAGGGWKMLMALGTFSSVVGGAIGWAANHFKWIQS
jgi:hypothetical protein